MIGAIRTWDILAHPVVTIQCFGWRVFFRALLSTKDQTFLSLLQQDHYFQASTSKAPEILDRCIGLELMAKEIYGQLAQRFPDGSPVREFLEELVRQEQHHAELLGLCREAVVRGRWNGQTFRPWVDCIPRLDQHLKDVRESLEPTDNHDKSLQVVVQIESSEINQILLGAIKATDSDFVRRLGPFRDCVKDHIAFICQSLPQLAPSEMLTPGELRAKFLP